MAELGLKRSCLLVLVSGFVQSPGGSMTMDGCRWTERAVTGLARVALEDL